MERPIRSRILGALLAGVLVLPSCRPGGPAPGEAPAPPAPPAPAEPPANFTVNISNQSCDLDPALIRVFLDGEKVVDGAFPWAPPGNPIRGGHLVSRHPFRLPEGTHRIRVEVLNVERSVEETFVLQGTLYANVLFWFEMERGGEPEMKIDLRIEKRGMAMY